MNLRETKHFFTALVIIAAFALLFFRFYGLGNPFSTNGIDEGVHLLQARQAHSGSHLYTEVGADQSPLGLLMFSALDGDPVSSRALVAVAFIGASLAVFFMMRKRFGPHPAAIFLFIIALDFTMLRDSRLASLDMLSTSFTVIGAIVLWQYSMRKNAYLLVISGLFISLGVMTKLFPAIFAVTIVICLLLEAPLRKYIRSGKWPGIEIGKGSAASVAAFLVGLLVPVLVLCAYLGFGEMLDGMLFRQASRGFDLVSKVSIPVFFGISFPLLLYFAGMKKEWPRYGIELAWGLPLFIFVLLQGRTFLHHFVIVAFPMAIVAADVLHRNLDMKKLKAILVFFVTFVMILASFFVLTAPQDPARQAADEVRAITSESDAVLSGDPLVNVYADRPGVLGFANTAKYTYLGLDESTIIEVIENRSVECVVVVYYLSEMQGLDDYLLANGFVLHGTVEGGTDALMYGFERTYEIYLHI